MEVEMEADGKKQEPAQPGGEEKKQEPAQTVVEMKRVVINNLSDKIEKAHLLEIFGMFGAIKQADVFPPDQWATSSSIKGFVVSAYLYSSLYSIVYD